TIVRAIKQSGRFCLMCSAEAFASDHVRREIYLADKYGKPMLPVRLDDAQMPEDIEYFLIDRQWVDLAGMDRDSQMRALKALFQS
ncbi:MAG: toll/interleukin-1 receptor domain-containing protein, partial [Henriciella sp.]|nr:toll/interleukin-1 receptor domain-containing protein [Henriciella sp.]